MVLWQPQACRTPGWHLPPPACPHFCLPASSRGRISWRGDPRDVLPLAGIQRGLSSSRAPIWKEAHTYSLQFWPACKSKCWPPALAAGMQKCKVKGTKAPHPFSPLYLFIQLVNLVWDAVCSVGSLCHPQATATLIKSKYFNKERATALHGGPTLCKQQ